MKYLAEREEAGLVGKLATRDDSFGGGEYSVLRFGGFAVIPGQKILWCFTTLRQENLLMWVKKHVPHTS